MSEVTVRMAATEADFDLARDLCRQWMDWHWQVFPEDGPRAGNPLDPEEFQSVIDDLPTLHARPTGAILLAEVDGQSVGCVMYSQMENTIAEVKRLFVNEGGRGYGVGKLLLKQMFEAMKADGYRTVRFSSARFLTHARRLYESVGFVDIQHPDGFPEELHSFVYFMERPLAPVAE